MSGIKWEENEVLAIYKATGEKRTFNSVFECANAFYISRPTALVAVARGGVKGWKLYDSPNNICLIILELEKQNKMLKEEAN